MIRPRWEWALDDAAGQPASGTPSPVFTTQYDAEQWLGEQWRELAAAGVAVVRLLHDGTQATPSIELQTP